MHIRLTVLAVLTSVIAGCTGGGPTESVLAELDRTV